MGIFDFLKNLLRRQGESLQHPTDPSASFHIAIKKAAPPLPGLPKPSGFSEGSPFQDLQVQIRGKGRPEFPFLSMEYSPSSRVPCADFTPFIVERLRAGDMHSIGQLMRGIIAANPGLGTKGEWIEEEAEKVVRAPLEKYFRLPDPDAYRQLRAMWIVFSREGGGWGIWLDDDQYFNPRLYVAQALSPYEIGIEPEIEKLRKKGNKIIREKRKDWLDVPLIKASELTIPPLLAGECVDKVRGLSIGGRLHLFSAVKAGGGCLPRLTGLSPRYMGLYSLDSNQEIIESGQFAPSQEPWVLKKSLGKSEILEACDQAGVTYKKSWNKDKLLQALLSATPDYVGQFIAGAKLAAVNPNYGDCLQGLLARAYQIEPVFKILCIV